MIMNMDNICKRKFLLLLAFIIIIKFYITMGLMAVFYLLLPLPLLPLCIFYYLYKRNRTFERKGRSNLGSVNDVLHLPDKYAYNMFWYENWKKIIYRDQTSIFEENEGDGEESVERKGLFSPEKNMHVLINLDTVLPTIR
eukprot:GFUD01122831.1.p1 GENE.GFUD01122831.1~~GFUD01122831.1.p1  ORF type:complete len:140 (+),score=7.88 GFUD01122831.1:119-538(+)